MEGLRTEQQRLLLLKAGDEAAFTAIYRQYSGRIYANMLKLVKSQDTALDLLQDLFLKVWNNRSAIDTDKVFGAFLFSMAQNLVRDFFRKAARDQHLQQQLVYNSTEFYDHIDDLIDRKETSEALIRAIESLPGQQRKIFTLCRIEGRSYEETASLLGLSPQTVGNQLVKASKAVKKYLAEHDAALVLAFFLLFGSLN